MNTESKTENRQAEDFEPKLIAFCCTYCAYNAADLAGSARLQYSPNIRIMRLPCSGTINLRHVLAAFEAGADGVYAATCHLGNCHFEKGNYRARKWIAKGKQLLDEIGINPQRLEIFHVGASEGARFAEVANQVTAKIKVLGPLANDKNEEWRKK